jgi:Uma2 family endonuclease
MEREIVLPDRKPYQEWLLGRAVETTGGGYRHAATKGWLAGRLMDWAKGRGYAGMSWTFRLAPRGEVRRPLIPDLAYLSYERARTLTREELDMPTIAPDAAFEILAPEDVPAHLQHKIDVYLATGASAVIFADPYSGSVSVHGANGGRTLRPGEAFVHDVLPGFTFTVEEMLAEARFPARSNPVDE